MKLSDHFNGKRILIWGYGREGRASENYIKTYSVPESVEIYEGALSGIREENYDLILKSPGIKADKLSEKFTSETELFLSVYQDQTIGITGTKGKSTTASLTAHALSECFPDRKVFLAGNIGIPCFEIAPEIDDDSIIVLELSCHQLYHISVSPKIAVFLNLFEEHLDYYGDFSEYFFAKQGISLQQSENDFLFVGDNVPEFPTKAKKTVIETGKTYDYALPVLGEHNKRNAEFVFEILSKCFGLPEGKIREAFKSFAPLPHRLEYVGTKDGVSYYNDSISTIPEATISAIEAIPDTKTVLIGGMDRGIHYDCLTDFVYRHPEYFYIFMYATGERIYKEIADLPNCFYEKDLTAAVKKAKEITSEGSSVVLSPAAPSYGYFRNFEERGNAYKELVMKL